MVEFTFRMWYTTEKDYMEVIMNQLKKSDFIFISLTLFSIFFGAGNLMFPPMLGYQSGSNLAIVLAGFMITAVILPILAVVAIIKADGIIKLGNKVHPVFSKIFAITVYLAIGPLLAIPRNATLAFTLIFNQTEFLLPYTIVFFAIAFWFSFSPNKLVNRIGKIMSPILISLIVLLFIIGMFKLPFNFGMPSIKYTMNPFTSGILDGYETLDVLASLNYGIVVLVWFRKRNLDESKLISTTIKSGCVAGFVLAIIYIITALLGSNIAPFLNQAENGAVILKFLSSYLLGDLGLVIIAIIFTIACLCVCIGLLTSISEFFTELQPKVKYHYWLIILTLISLFLSNYGLNNILKYSIPALLLIYPIGIVLVILSLFNSKKIVYQTSVFITFIISLSTTINKFPYFDKWITQDHFITKFNQILPLNSNGLAWLFPFIVIFTLTTIYTKLKKSS